MIFVVLLVIPLSVTILAFVFLRGISWKEFLLYLVAQILVAGILATLLYYQNVIDHETWSGWVTFKERETHPCAHSYECNCRNIETCSGSGKSRSCSTSRVCSTCYEHINDYDWIVYTSNHEKIEIDRIDSQGYHEPPRWTSVKLLEPTVQRHEYVNYIKAAPDSLFRHRGLREKYESLIPSYPDRIYDYYRLDRLVLQGVSVPDQRAWNEGLAQVNAEIGSKKQVNIIVVLTNQGQEWFYALEEAWIGGKKNDVILVIGVESETMKPLWSQVMAWTTDKVCEVKLRDAILDLSKVTPDDTLKVVKSSITDHYKRNPMANFEYLRGSIVPSKGELFLCIAVGILVSALLAYLFNTYDVFGEGGSLRPKNPFH